MKKQQNILIHLFNFFLKTKPLLLIKKIKLKFTTGKDMLYSIIIIMKKNPLPNLFAAFHYFKMALELQPASENYKLGLKNVEKQILLPIDR